MSKRFTVLGLGSFGFGVAQTLFEEGHDVIALDIDNDLAQKIRPFCSQAIIGDATQKEMLATLGLDEMDAVVISMGGNTSASTLVTLYVKELGAKRIVATDIDFRACMEALENVRANHCEANICVVNDSYSCGRPEGFELLLANLTISTIVTIGRHFKTLVRPQAAMVLSGFTAEQVDVVCDAVGPAKVIEKRNLEGWAGILAIRAGK